MDARLRKSVPIALAAVAAAVWGVVLSGMPVSAQCGCCKDGMSGHGSMSGHQHGDAATDDAAQTQPAAPHGGRLTTAPPLSFEVVYFPQEIRVYLYGTMPYPQSAKDVGGEVALQRPYDEKATRIALKYVAPPEGKQDYLSAAVDLSRVKDGELVAAVKLANLPLENRPGITFQQSVVLLKTKPEVKLAALDQSDRAGIDRQRVCPVTGAALGNMGDPIKVLVGGQPLYLCCKGCLGKVQRDPEAYLRKANQANQVQ